MQSSCKQSDAFNQRKEDVGNYQSVKVKHITQTHRRNTKGAQRRLDSHPHLQIACRSLELIGLQGTSIELS